VLGFPFHFLDNNRAMNVRPKNYSWPDFYDQVIGLTEYSFSWRAIVNRLRANRTTIPKWLNVVRAVSSEGFGRMKYYKEVRRRLDADPPFRRYFEQETTELPEFFVDRVRRELGPLYEWLPVGALYHDPHAYLKAEEALASPVNIGARIGSEQAQASQDLIGQPRIAKNNATSKQSPILASSETNDAPKAAK
jgi:hypothetical protein